MNRRHLLRSTLATRFGGPLLPGLARARPGAPAQPAPILLQRPPLAGFQSHRRPDRHPR